MAPSLQARVLDNHAIYNIAFALTEFRSPQFYDAVRAVRVAAYDQILQLPDNETVILTDAYFEDSDWGWESWKAIEQLARLRRWTFLTISLACDAPQHRRRIVTEERAGRGKLQDPSYVDRVAARRLIEKAGPLSSRLDITHRSAEDAASILVDWIEGITSAAELSGMTDV